MKYSFKIWERQRRHLAPEPDRVLPLVQAAKGEGMTRKQLGGAVDLERDVLDELLAGLVNAGLLTYGWENGVPVYRATSGVG
jgi:hypothetical protein